MEKQTAFIFILLVTCSLQAIAQPLATTVVGELDSGLGNTSALFYWENRLWTSNDHGNLTLHCLDTLTGTTLQRVGCDTTFSDMEEVAQDSVYFYFGDFGNNHERLRNDLRILRLRKSDLTRGICRFDTIAFSYSGYDPAGAGARRLPTTDYDCEAMVAAGDSLFLFTKQWSSRRTTCFALPKEPGSYTALPRFTLDVDGLVTGACHTAHVTPEGTLLFDPSSPAEAISVMPKGTVKAVPAQGGGRFPSFVGVDASGKTTGYAVVGTGSAHGPNGDIVLHVLFGGLPSGAISFNPPPRNVNKPGVDMTDMEIAQRTAFNGAMAAATAALKALASKSAPAK